MAVNFNASGEYIDRTATLTPPANWTWYGWVRRASTTSGQFYSLTQGSGERIGVWWSSSTTDRLHIFRRNDGGGSNGEWICLQANLGVTLTASKWWFLAVTQSGTGTPVVRTACPADGVDLASRTVSLFAGTPSGTPDTSSTCTATIGNWLPHDYGLNGDMAWSGFHNVVLTEGELREAMWRGFTLRGQVHVVRLEDASRVYDLTGNAYAHTSSGIATVTVEPPVTPLWLLTENGWVPVEPDTTQALSGSIDGTGTFTGDATLGSQPLSGSISGSGSFAGALDYAEPWGISGSIFGTGSISGDINFADQAISGEITATGTLTGSLDYSGAQALSGSIDGTGTVTGSIDFTPIELAGSFSGTATFAGDINYVMDLFGEVAGVGTLSGALSGLEIRGTYGTPAAGAGRTSTGSPTTIGSRGTISSATAGSGR